MVSKDIKCPASLNEEESWKLLKRESVEKEGERNEVECCTLEQKAMPAYQLEATRVTFYATHMTALENSGWVNSSGPRQEYGIL